MQNIKENVSEIGRITTGQEQDTGSNAVKVNVPQGYNAKINIRLYPVKDFQLTPFQPHCQPRQGAARKETKPLDLPESLVAKFKTENKKITSWLAQDAANAQLFLTKPVEAMLKAGLELTRSEQKALDRNHRIVSETHVVAPGVKVENITVTAHTSGRVGDVIKKQTSKTNKRESDCGCGAERKE